VARDAATGAVIGRGGIRRAEVLGRPEVELFYAVAPSHWGRGIAGRMAAAALELGFRRAGVPDVVAFTTEGNRASQRVIERLGLARQGLFEHAGLPHVLYRLTRATYLAR
jgi:RimJ/RimL family protein N-acetyltransferase